MKKLINKLRNAFPLVRKSTMAHATEVQRESLQKMHNTAISGIEQRHEEKLRTEHARIDGVLHRWMNTNYFRLEDGDRYRIMVEFDARALHGWGGSRELECVAESVARRIRGEILTSKFVEKAYLNERRGYPLDSP